MVTVFFVVFGGMGCKSVTPLAAAVRVFVLVVDSLCVELVLQLFVGKLLHGLGTCGKLALKLLFRTWRTEKLAVVAVREETPLHDSDRLIWGPRR